MNKQRRDSKVSVIVTLLDESKTIDELLQSLMTQSVLPQSIIITDGGSTDGTWEKLLQWKQKNLPVELRIAQVKGNRSVGRNRAVELVETELIASTDAGCVPEKDWLAELVRAQKRSGSLVVAGYYRGLPLNDFQIAQVPYVLTMPNSIDYSRFLPATRSMLFDRKWFLENGGFDVGLSDNEDYALARKIEKIQQTGRREILSFTDKAVVGWRPRRSLLEFAWMIFRFARGDARARLWRPKVLLIFLRYLSIILLMSFALIEKSTNILMVGCLAASWYLLWSISKNLRYAQSSWYWLPVLQIASDIAVMFGTIAGLVQVSIYNFNLVKKNDKRTFPFKN